MSLEKICIAANVSLREAMQVLNDGHQRIVMVVNDQKRLLGVIADSDIRRAILNDTPLDTPAHKIMKTSPLVVSPDESEERVKSLMGSTTVYEIPIVDSTGKVIGLRKLDGVLSARQDAEVVIMAGGMGRRLLPLTDSIPQPLIPVADKPILFNLLDRLLQYGFDRITLTLNYMGEMIQQAVESVPHYKGVVRFVFEPMRMGTAGALSLLPEVPKHPFLVMNADLMTRIDFVSMLQFHAKEQNAMTVAVREHQQEISFGVVRMKNAKVESIEEKPIYAYYINAGIYVLDPSLVSYIPKQSFFDMPDLINAVLKHQRPVGGFPVHEYWVDIGGHKDLTRARGDFSGS